MKTGRKTHTHTIYVWKINVGEKKINKYASQLFELFKFYYVFIYLFVCLETFSWPECLETFPWP